MFRPSTPLSVKDREGAGVKNVDFCLPNAVPTFDSVPKKGRLSRVGRSGSSNPRGERVEVSPSYAEAKSKAGREEALFISLCSDDEDNGLDFDLPNAALTPDKGPLSEVGRAGSVNPRAGGKKFSPRYDEAKSPKGVVEDLFITDCSDDEGGLMDFVQPDAVLTLDTVPNIGPLSEVGRAGCSNLQAGEKEFSPTNDEAKSTTEKPKTFKEKCGNFLNKVKNAVELPFHRNNKVQTIIPSELDANSPNHNLKGDAGLASPELNAKISPDKQKASKRPVFGWLQGGKVESVPTPKLEADPAVPDVKDVVDLASHQSKTNVDPDKQTKKASKSRLFHNPWKKKVETVVLTQQLDADPAIPVVKDGAADLARRELKTHIRFDRPELKAGIAAANAELQTCAVPANIGPKNARNPGPKDAGNPEPKGARYPWQKHGKSTGPKDGKSPGRKEPRNLRPKEAGNPGPKDAEKPGPKDAGNPEPKGARWPWQKDGKSTGPKDGKSPGRKEPRNLRPKETGNPGPKDAEKPGPKDAGNPEPKGARWPWQKDGKSTGPKDGKSPGRKEPKNLRPKEAGKPGPKEAGKPGPKDAKKPGPKDAEKPGPKDAGNPEPKGARWPWQKDGKSTEPKDGKSPGRKEPRNLRPKEAGKPGPKDAEKPGPKDAGNPEPKGARLPWQKDGKSTGPKDGKSPGRKEPKNPGPKDARKPQPKDARKSRPKVARNPQPNGAGWPWPKEIRSPRPKGAGKPGPKDPKKSRPTDGKSATFKDHTSPADAKPVPAPETSSTSGYFHSKYYLSKNDVLGEGSFGKVYKGTRRSDGKEVAIKVMQRSWHDRYVVTPGYTKPLLTEVALMLKMREAPISPFVIQMYDWYEDPRSFGLVLEYSQHCETLWRFMTTRFRQTESVARVIMHQAVQAVQDCLNHGVFHTDIHPANFLLDKGKMKLKLIDFGLGHILTNDGYNSKDFRGAPLFTPPEIHTEPKYYAMPTNVWALGVLLYTMVNGFYPFPERAKKSHKLQLTEKCFSKEICDLIKRCLAKEPTKRPTIQQILDHDWFKIK